MPAPTTAPSRRGKPWKPNLCIPASPEFRDWVRGYVRSRRTTISSLFDRLVTEAAAAEGYTLPPPPR